MIYEVRARLLFTEEDEALDFMHDCDLAMAKATSINTEQDNAEFSVYEEIENHHDENPNAPCNRLFIKSQQPA